jgi:HD-GYP domain-containing protein (c-di-GMP phosphodiesterase class II)
MQSTMLKLQEILQAAAVAVADPPGAKHLHIAGHQARVARLACAIGREMAVSPPLLKGLRVMGFLHDIGKIAIPKNILCKTSQLSPDEFNVMKSHPLIGYGLIREMQFPRPIALAILQHHERLDGSGYPLGLAGRDILLEAKILSVADVTDAMVSNRPYRPAIDLEQSLKEIWRNVGTLFDPDVVTACLSLFRDKGFAHQVTAYPYLRGDGNRRPGPEPPAAPSLFSFPRRPLFISPGTGPR